MFIYTVSFQFDLLFPPFYTNQTPHERSRKSTGKVSSPARGNRYAVGQPLTYASRVVVQFDFYMCIGYTEFDFNLIFKGVISLSSKRVHLTSGEANPISKPYDDRDKIERLSAQYDLEPWEVSKALRYYGSVEDYIRLEKDDPIR
jgi:hypothetical protein